MTIPREVHPICERPTPSFCRFVKGEVVEAGMWADPSAFSVISGKEAAENARHLPDMAGAGSKGHRDGSQNAISEASCTRLPYHCIRWMLVVLGGSRQTGRPPCPSFSGILCSSLAAICCHGCG